MINILLDFKLTSFDVSSTEKASSMNVRSINSDALLVTLLQRSILHGHGEIAPSAASKKV